MAMTDVKISVSESIAQYAVAEDPDARLLRDAMILFPYIQNETISHGKAAELLGINKLDLLAIYGNLGIAYIDESHEELESDVFAIQKVRGLAQ